MAHDQEDNVASEAPQGDAPITDESVKLDKSEKTEEKQEKAEEEKETEEAEKVEKTREAEKSDKPEESAPAVPAAPVAPATEEPVVPAPVVPEPVASAPLVSEPVASAPFAQEPVGSEPAVGAATAKPAGLVIALAVATAVFVIISTVMTVLYVGERGDRVDGDESISQLKADLASIQQKNTDMQATLTELESQALSEEGYEALQACVDQGVKLEETMKAWAANPESIDTDISVVILDFVLMQNCTDAAQHLE